jgi:hypothetical protein
MSTTIPPNPDVQRRKSLYKANAVRRRRRDTRAAIKQLAPPIGAQAACEILLGVPDWAASMSVARLLRAVNGIGSVRAARIAGVNANTPLSRLDSTARAVIARRTVRAAAPLRKRGGALPAPLPVNRYAQAQEALQSANRIRFACADELRYIADPEDLQQRAARAADLIADSARGSDLDGLPLGKILEAAFGRRDRSAARIILALRLRSTTQLGMLSTSRAQQTAVLVRARASARAHPAPALTRAA